MSHAMSVDAFRKSVEGDMIQHTVSIQQVRERAKQLEMIFEAMTDGVFVYDREGHLVQVNTAGRRLFALDVIPDYTSRPLEQRIAQLMAHDMNGQLLLKEDYPMVRLLKGEVLTGKKAMDVLVYTLDGREVQVSIGGAPLYDETGHQIGAVMTVRDMSERYLLERCVYDAARAAKERATQLETIFDAMVDGVFVYDREGHFVQMNATGRKLLEHCLPPDYEILPLQQRFAQVVALDAQGEPLSRERLPASRILAGEMLTPANAVDVMLRKIDGQVVHLSVTGGPLYDTHDQLIGAVAIARDITQGRRLEQLERRLHAETEARLALLQMVLDELPSSVYLVQGSDARLVLANRTATTVWGATWAHNQPMSEFLKKNDIHILGMDGKVLAPEQFATLRALRTGEPVYQHQESIRHPDGTTLPVLVNAVTFDASQLFSSSANTRKHFAEAPEPAALVMHQNVTALKEAERLKDEFIAVAAHELRNPLAVLKGYAQTLLFQTRQEKGSHVDEWQQEALYNIDKATLRLVELTEDLLDATRLQAGRLELHPEPTDLVALARRVVKRLQTTTEQHRLSLCTSLEYLVVCVDPRRIEQVLINLINNAIKYSPAGGPIEIAIWEKSGTSEVVLSVHDCGIGIPAYEQAHIFGRFARAENARKIGGTGLGLYICRALVEQHSGRIWFESAEGKGSTFFVVLPIASEAVSLS